MTSNAKKVKLTYRTAKNKKRTATIKVRKGTGARTLAKGSKKIYAQAQASARLRSSARVAVQWSQPTARPTVTPPPATSNGPVAPTVEGWSTQAVTLPFGQREYITATVTGRAYCSGTGPEMVCQHQPDVVVEARKQTGDSWGPWQMTEAFNAGGESYDPPRNATPILRVPTVGTWQVRLRTLANPTNLEVISAPRLVTLLAPVCTRTNTQTFGARTITTCEIVVGNRGLSRLAPRYILTWYGSTPLDQLRPSGFGVSFHGDDVTKAGQEMLWPEDADGNLQVFDYAPDDSMPGWTLSHGAVLIQPLSSYYIWQTYFNAFNGQFAALDMGNDFRALGEYLQTDTYFYMGGSGGSFFLGDTFIKAGIHMAPGPVSLNCGAGGVNNPTAYAGKAIPDYNLWEWLPTRDTTTRAQVQLRFAYGDDGFDAPNMRESYLGYTSLGFDTTEVVYPGAGHCGFIRDDWPALRAWLGAKLGW